MISIPCKLLTLTVINHCFKSSQAVTTPENRRLIRQEMKRSETTHVLTVYKISVQMNYLECQICQINELIMR